MYLFRVGDMKLIVGHPGVPDGNIKPDEMMIHHGKRNGESKEYGIKTAEFNKAFDKKTYLFNITGLMQLQNSFLRFISTITFKTLITFTRKIMKNLLNFQMILWNTKTLLRTILKLLMN